jgi:hypothetical protein
MGTMQKIASPQQLQNELQRILAYCQGPGRPSREKVAADLDELATALLRQSSGEDNSWGRGYYPLPPGLAALGRFTDALKPSNLVEHKVFVDEGTHMLTAKLSKVSVMAADLKTLLRLGLLRIQSNGPGMVSFYFGGYPVESSPLT